MTDSANAMFSSASIHVLVVCTGNTCRSPMGEHLLRHLAAGAGRGDIEVRSAGMRAAEGLPASAEAVEVLHAWGLDLNGHGSRMVTSAAARRADVILVMERHHADELARLLPRCAVKTYLITHFGPADVRGRDVSDPIGLDLNDYEQCARLIEACMAGFLDKVDAIVRARDNTVALGADHRGVELKSALGAALQERGYRVVDCGADSTKRTDFPLYALEVAERVAWRELRWGILVCASGIGMSIAANKVIGARAALVRDMRDAVLSREHNDANVLVLAGDVGGGGAQPLCELAVAWLHTPHLGGRYRARNEMIALYEQGYSIQEAAAIALGAMAGGVPKEQREP